MLNSRTLAAAEFREGNSTPPAEKNDGLVLQHPAVTAPIPEELHDPYVPTSIPACLKGRNLGWMVNISLQLIRARIQLARCNKRDRWVRVRGKVRVHNE